MFYESKNNWITGERGLLEKIVWGVIALLACMIIFMVICCFLGKNDVHPSADVSTPVESVQAENNEYKTTNAEPRPVKQEISQNTYQQTVPASASNNTVKVINLTEEREKRAEQRAIERAERKQQRLENKLQKQQERTERRLEKQRLKEEKKQQKLNEKNNSSEFENSTNSYNSETTSVETTPEE